MNKVIASSDATVASPLEFSHMVDTDRPGARVN